MALRLPENLAGFHKRSWRAGAGLLVLLIEEVSLGFGWKALQVGWNALRALADRPLREGGALVLLILVLSIIWAAVDPVRLARERKAMRLAQKAALTAPPPEMKKEETPQLPPLTLQEENLVHFARLFWTDTLGLAVHRVILISQKLREILGSTDRLVELISYPIWELEASRQRLLDQFEYRQTPPDTIMTGLRHVTERYMWVVQWVNYCQDSCALDLEGLAFFDPKPGEISWGTLHQNFRKDFEVLCERPGFASLNHYRQHNLPSDRSESPQTGLGERGRAMDLLLRQRSDTEGKFLALLAPDAESYEAREGPWIPREVYQAGEELARRGIFAERELRAGEQIIQLFTVPNHIAPFIKRHIFPESEMRMEIRLNLHRVPGTGASGSGAPAGGGIHY